MGQNFKKVICVICGCEVSKRSTLSLVPVGQDGRACRSHEEVRQMVNSIEEMRQKKKKDSEVQAKMEKVTNNLRVIQGAATVRALHTVHGVPAEVLYARMRLRGWPGELVAEIKKEVARQGGPKMSQEEVLTSMMAYGELQKRATAAQLDA